MSDNELALFEGGGALAKSDAYQELLKANDKLAGGVGNNRRISIKGGKFRKLLNGEQIAVTRDPAMNVIVVDSAAVGRTYYEGDYDPEKVTKPRCWSLDTDTPAPDVPEPVASRCADCPMNVKGSARQGEGRACKFSQRVALAIEGDLETVYQMSLPATSLFGEPHGGRMPMQGYARLLREHKAPIITVVTEMSFDDEDAEYPKLLFKPVRQVEEHEFEALLKLRETPECKRAIEFTVPQVDGVEDEAPKPKKEKKTKKKKAKKEKVVVEEPEPDEPSVVKKKSKAAEPESKTDLADLITAWDDE